MSQIDPFAAHQRGTTSPAIDAFAVTPDDVADFPTTARGIYVGGGGDISLVTPRGTAVTFRALQAGSVLPCAARRINATGTTASDLVALV